MFSEKTKPLFWGPLACDCTGLVQVLIDVCICRAKATNSERGEHRGFITEQDYVVEGTAWRLEEG